jgi:hypothetical protein
MPSPKGQTKDIYFNPSGIKTQFFSQFLACFSYFEEIKGGL